jgi:putative spermidine/putrescine transport system ATP-binding protein
VVQLEGQADRLPGQLSGGQQQRVAIARAIVVEPPLVLMDEPLSNLDAKLRLETRSEIRRIHRELGRITIYVTHDQEEALSLADRIVVLRDGSVQQVAPPHEVYAQPANLNVARFMGYRNIIDFERGLARSRENVELRREGLALTGTPRQPLNGGPVSAAIRPEDIAVGSADGINPIPGVVSHVEYCGRDSLVDVSVPGGLRLQLRTDLPVVPSDRLTLNVPPTRVLVFPSAPRSEIRNGRAPSS